MSSVLIDRRLIRFFDWGLFLISIAIPVVGLVVLYSAGYNPDAENTGWLPFGFESQAFTKQLMYFLAGLFVMAIGFTISPQWVFRSAWWIYCGAILLLIAVLIFGVKINGARSWIPLGGGFNIQPAEFMKLGVVIALSRYLTLHAPKEGTFRLYQLFMPALIVAFPVSLIMLQPDFGSAAALTCTSTLMIIFVGINRRLVITSAIVGVILVAASAPLIWNNLKPHQQRRLATFINPEADPKGSGYHITQSIIAVGSGEFFGKGFLGGTQTQLAFLPEHTTDFIFSVLAEEWGFVGSVLVVALYLLLIIRLAMVALRAKDSFGVFLSVGVGAAFFVHSFINIGMVIGVIPVVGIPLPLLSYGGSSVLSMMLALGLILGISMRRTSFAQGGK